MTDLGKVQFTTFWFLVPVRDSWNAPMFNVQHVTGELKMHQMMKINDRSPNSTWLVTSRHVLTRHDTFDESSPCILAVSSLSNNTDQRARHVSCRVKT